MPIQNIELTSIEGKRFIKRGERIRRIDIKLNSSVTVINQVGEQEAEVEFRYTADFVGMGYIRIEGRLLFQGDATALTTSWAQTGNMPDEMAQELHSAILGSCTPESVIIARALHLPPPVQPPKVDIRKAKGGKMDLDGGMEVA